jgi:hypothetical protein
VGGRKRKMSCVDGIGVESDEEGSVDGKVRCCVGNESERRKSLGKVMLGGETELDCPAIDVQKRRVKKRAVCKTH